MIAISKIIDYDELSEHEARACPMALAIRESERYRCDVAVFRDRWGNHYLADAHDDETSLGMTRIALVEWIGESNARNAG